MKPQERGSAHRREGERWGEMGGCGEVWGDRGRSGHRRRRASLPTSASAAPTSSLRGKGGGRSTETRTRLRARRSPATTPALSVLFDAVSLSSDRRAGKPPPRHRARRAHGRVSSLCGGPLWYASLRARSSFSRRRLPFSAAGHTRLSCGLRGLSVFFFCRRVLHLWRKVVHLPRDGGGAHRQGCRDSPRLPEITRDYPFPLGSPRLPSAPSRPPLDLPSTSPRTTRQVVAFKGAPLAHATPCVSKDIPARRRGQSRATSADLG